MTKNTIITAILFPFLFLILRSIEVSGNLTNRLSEYYKKNYYIVKSLSTSQLNEYGSSLDKKQNQKSGQIMENIGLKRLPCSLVDSTSFTSFSCLNDEEIMATKWILKFESDNFKFSKPKSKHYSSFLSK